MSTSVFNDQYEELSEEFTRDYDNAEDEIQDPFKLPTLYALTPSTGKHKVYSIGFDGRCLVSEYGQVGGKLQVNRREVVPKAKRSLYQQAIQETRVQWNKKLKQRYRLDMDETADAVTKQVMLANKFDPTKIIEWPVHMQVKYDGMRFTASLEDGVVVLRSRAGNPFPHLEHLKVALRPSLEVIGCTLDGELILPSATFQETCSAIKSTNEIHERNHEICAMLFDVMMDGTYEERWEKLHESIEESESVYIADSTAAHDLTDIQEYFDEVSEEGHEGIMVRLPGSPYVHGRTNGLMKMKTLETDEGEIVDVVEGVGKHTGMAIFVISDSLGVTTHVVPAATQDERRRWYEDRETLIGSRYQFMFNERMSGTNAPRNPVGVRFME